MSDPLAGLLAEMQVGLGRSPRSAPWQSKWLREHRDELLTALGGDRMVRAFDAGDPTWTAWIFPEEETTDE